MKKILTFCTLILAFAFTFMSLSLTGCGGGGGGGSGGGDTTGSTVTGPRYVYSTEIASMTSVFTFKFTGDTIDANGGAGVAYREDFTTSTMAFIPGHKYPCSFTYTVSGSAVTITWPSEIINLPTSEQSANTPNGNAWALAFHIVYEATGSIYWADSVTFTKTGNDLVAPHQNRTWVYRQE